MGLSYSYGAPLADTPSILTAAFDAALDVIAMSEVFGGTKS